MFASAEYPDPGLAPRLEVLWTADAVQLHPATHVHSDGPELTWTRFAPGTGPYAQAVLQDGPRAYWRLDDAPGSTFGLADWSGSNLHASPVGVGFGEPGATADGDTSVYFNGSSSHAEASEDQIADTFTIEAWVKRGATGGIQTVFSRGESSGGGFRLMFDANDYLALSSGDGSPSFPVFARSAVPVTADSGWHHVAASKSGSQVKLYIDGSDQTVVVDTIPTLTAGLGMVVVGATIGSHYPPAEGRWYGHYFNGWIDEPAVYGHVLTPAQVAAHVTARTTAGTSFQRFEVHRSPSAGFTPSGSTLLTTITDPVIQHYRDTSARASATFYYKIVTVTSTGSAGSNQLAVATPPVGQATITIQPGVSLHGAEATTLASESVCANNGGAAGLTASSSQRGLLRFDLRQIPTGSDVTSAELGLWTFRNGGGQTIAVHRLNADWDEGTGTGGCDGSGASWSDRQANVPWSSAGGEFATAAETTFTSTGATPHWETSQLTGLVEEWVGTTRPNFGVLLKHASEAGAAPVTWTSDEYGGSPALRPKLVVTYLDGSDPKEPTGGMGAPGQGATVSGTVNLTANARDDSRVTQVEFVQGAGDTVIATDTADPWQASLDTTSLPNGELVLKMRATDDAGHVSTSPPMTVTVANSAPPTTAVTGASGTATVTVDASASDDVAVSRVEFYVDGDRFANDTTAPYQATLATLGFPVYDGTHTLTTRAYDGHGNATTSAGYPLTVANTAASMYKATFASTAVPLELTYDPAAPSQEKAWVDLTVTNTSTVAWAAASTKLRYRWYSADATPVVTTSGDLSLGTDVAAGASRTITVHVDPPALAAQQLRARYRLRFDLYESGSGSYFAGKGNAPLERWVTVTRQTADELGLERYQQYEPEQLGGGFHSSVNLGNGNHVVQATLLEQPGRGLNTLATLTYNSLEHGSVSPLGNGWSLALSGLTPLGLPLDIHPNASDTLAGRTAKWVGFTDADGSYHRLSGNAAGTHYTAPSGVHLYVRYDPAGSGGRRWLLSKPDGTRFTYGQLGYPKYVEDRNGNALTYNLQDPLPAGEDAFDLPKRITSVTDAGGRDVTLAYYSKAETALPALRGKLKSLTDHAGRVTRFDYYEDGNLMRITRAGGVGDTGSFFPSRSIVLTYTNPAGSGPAIGTLAARKTPDPATSQGRLLYSLIDYRGNETGFAYHGSGASSGRLASRTDRAGKTTNFTYSTTTTVARPLSRTSIYAFDSAGRVTTITNPLGLQTAVAWTTDNTVSQVTNVATGRSSSYSHNANGYLTSTTNENGDLTWLTYENLPADAADTSVNWPGGRSIGHLSQLQTLTLPEGVVTMDVSNDYRWSFDYTATGNLWKVTDPLGHVTTHTYNADGTLAKTTLPDNGDGILRETLYESYDANGLPTQVTDPAGNRAKTAYGADGRPLWVQDPLHFNDTGADTRSYRQVFDYDAHGRVTRTSAPKSTSRARGLLVWTGTAYDANDNPFLQVAPYYAIDAGAYGPSTITTFDAMDRPISIVGPDAGEETKTVYDDAGRVHKLTAPKGAATPFADDYTTIAGYDLLDRPNSETRYQLDGNGQIEAAKTRTTVYCYDAAGDLRSITGPKGAAGLNCPSTIAWPYTPTSQDYTTKIGYDGAHRQTSVTNPLGHTTNTEYDRNGAVTKETRTLGTQTVETAFEYNHRGDKTKTIEPFEPGQWIYPVEDPPYYTGKRIISITEYDPLGNVKRQISPRAYDTNPGGPYTQHVTAYSYDALGQVVRVELPKASAETQAYSHNAYDANGRLVWTSLPTTAAAAGTVAAADKTVNEYWDGGQLYSTTVGGSAKVRYDYTAQGWQAWRLPETAAGSGVGDYARMMLWDYYPDGLLRAERDGDGRRSSYAYDANGNQTSVAQAQGISGEVLSVTNVFNGFDEPASVRTSKLGTTNSWLSAYGYDLHGNVSSLDENKEETSGGGTVGDARRFAYSYDAADRPLAQTDDFGTASTLTDDQRLSFEFDQLGRLSTRTVAKRLDATGYATEQTQETSYFLNGLIKTLVSKDGAGTQIASHTLSYLKDSVYLNGNKTGDVFRVAKPASEAGQPNYDLCRTADCTASWEYDGRERLTKAIDGTGTTSEYTLDIAGNVSLERRNGSEHRTASYTGQRLVADTLEGVSSRYLYDGQGNVDCVVLSSWAGHSCPAAATGQPVAAALRTDNVYDYRGRLVAVRAYNSGAAGDRSEYRYDPLSRVTGKTATEGTTTTSEMVYLGTSDAVVREMETGAGTSKTRSYAFDLLGTRVGLSETADGVTSRYSYVYDPLGSAELLLDQANAVKATYGYTAYGEANPKLTKTASGFSANTNAYRYTGKRWDPAAKAYEMGARHYFPAQGRWFQQDTYANALANLGLSLDPLNANRYLFTGANPINYVELDGHVAGGTPGHQYEDGGGDPDPTEQAKELAGGYKELGCGTGDGNQFVCGAIAQGIYDQLAVWRDRDLLCEQTRRAQHCSRAGWREALALAIALTDSMSVAGMTRHAIRHMIRTAVTRMRTHNAAEGASNLANASRLAAQLTREEARAIFTRSGGLKASVIRDSRRIVSGDKIGNADVIGDLKALGGSISDWGKYTTPTFKSPAGGFQVHFYFNPKTGQAYYGRDYKAVFAGRPR